MHIYICEALEWEAAKAGQKPDSPFPEKMAMERCNALCPALPARRAQKRIHLLKKCFNAGVFGGGHALSAAGAQRRGDAALMPVRVTGALVLGLFGPMRQENTTAATALCRAAPLPAMTGGEAPDWIHLLPAGPITTADGRGPYRCDDLAGLAARSLVVAGGRLPVDENHSTDLAAPHGAPSPARGWIVALEARDDGLWGRVEWTDSGKALLVERAYRGISPVFLHTKNNKVTLLLRAALTNTPNLRGLAALHQESNMDFMQKLRAALGLADDADEAAILAACEQLMGGNAARAAEMKTAIASIAKVAGASPDADSATVLQAVTALASKVGASGDDAIAALQSEIATLTEQLNDTRRAIAVEKATAFVDGAIREGRVGVKPLREHYIARHAVDPAGVEKEIAAMPILSGTWVAPPQNKKHGITLNSEQLAVCRLLGVKPEEYGKTLAAEAAVEEEAAR